MVWLVENVEMVQVWVWCANTGLAAGSGTTPRNQT